MIVLSVRYIKSSRIPWRCDECLRKFCALTSYRKTVFIDHKFYSVKSCTTCDGIIQDLIESGAEDVLFEDIYREVTERYGSWVNADLAFGTIGVVNDSDSCF